MKQKNKLTLLALSGVSALVFSTTSCYAIDGTITGSTIRMRENPTTSSKIITTLDENDKVEVLEKNEDWYKIVYKGDEGFVYGKYIKVAENVVETNSKDVENNTEDEVKKEENIKITLKNDVKLYSLPLISSSKIEEVKKDGKVNILQQLNNWVYVNIDNKTGWLQNQELQYIKEEVKTEETKEQQKNETEKIKKQETKETSASITKVGYVNVQSAKIRKGPSTSTDYIETVNLNEKVTIVAEEDDWYKIKYGKTDGYIYKKLVSDEKVKETTSRSSEDRTLNSSKDSSKQEETKEDISSNIKEEDKITTVTGQDIVDYAENYLGCKYVSGGNGPSSFDCSGFTTYVYKHFGYSLNRTSVGQQSNGTQVSKSNLEKGDILVFLDESKSKVGHVGIYIGGNRFIHAANPSKGVVEESLSNSYYDQRYVTARRILN